MDVTVRWLDDPENVIERCGPMFAAQPVEATTVAAALVQRAAVGAADGYRWAVVESDGRPVGVVSVDVPTRRSAVFVAASDSDRLVVDALADAVVDAGLGGLPLSAEMRVGAAYAARQAVALGVGAIGGVSIQLQRFDPTAGAEALESAPEVRLASEGDVGWLCDWFVGFDRETFDQGFDPEPAVRSKLGALWLLEVDGAPVSMAAASPAAFGVRRLHAVYTPPAARGRGFGSAVTIGVVREVLGGGDRAALFADLANPITVPMYQRLGFEPVAEHQNWTFDQR